MTTLAHLSDLHFGRLHHEAANDLLEHLRAANPDLVVISGDLTQRARRREFEDARAYLDQLPRRPLVVPGNHDLPAWNLFQRFTKPTERFRRYIERERYPFQESGDISALGINTTRPHGWYLDWGRGRINLRQIRRIRETFAPVSSKRLRVVVTHHPFLRPPQEERRHLVHGPRDVMRLLAESGVDLLLAGHFHKTHSDVAVTRYPEAQGIVVAQTSTSTSWRFRAEPNAYNWFEYEDGRLRVVVQAWKDGDFHAASEKRYHKSLGHWVRDDIPDGDDIAAGAGMRSGGVGGKEFER